MASIEFNKIELEKAESDFSKAKLDGFQRNIIVTQAEMMCKFINMSELAMRGFIYRTIMDWQKKNKHYFSDASNMTTEDRIKKIGFFIVERLGFYLKRLVMTDEEKQNIDIALKDGLQYYKNHFSKR
ncbi:MAG: hypothetical protein ACFFAI_11115 [Promethearchaeota archaeon]